MTSSQQFSSIRSVVGCNETGLIAPIIFSLRLPVLASAVLVLAAPLICQQ
jgi:hypothetical protein